MSEAIEFYFKRGDEVRTVSLTLEMCLRELEDTAVAELPQHCNCAMKPRGETNVVECDCGAEDFYSCCEFDLEKTLERFGIGVAPLVWEEAEVLLDRVLESARDLPFEIEGFCGIVDAISDHKERNAKAACQADFEKRIKRGLIGGEG